MKRKWQGTTLFVAIFAGLSATLGLRLLQSPVPAVGASNAGAAPATTPPKASTSTAAAGGKASGTAASGAVRTISGASENTPYGAVQVDVKFTGKKIAGITVVTIPDSSNYDQSVAQAVPPTLLNEILASQSTNVSTVSGGTYTSVGYLQSVQSAIDKL
ncbi:MAG: FMN-binding protein, partial [Acidobacteria bacterium]|nr:FMN-binding protein [Acidobacteriota bacterium]